MYPVSLHSMTFKNRQNSPMLSDIRIVVPFGGVVNSVEALKEVFWMLKMFFILVWGVVSWMRRWVKGY